MLVHVGQVRCSLLRYKINKSVFDLSDATVYEKGGSLHTLVQIKVPSRRVFKFHKGFFIF